MQKRCKLSCLKPGIASFICSGTFIGIVLLCSILCLPGFKSCPIIHRASVNVFLAWMDYAVFQYRHHVPGETARLVTLEDAVSNYFVVLNFQSEGLIKY